MGGGVDRLQIDAFMLESLDALNEAFPVGIKPFLIGFKWKQVVRIWVRH